jgi:hypothetical protein
MYHYMLAAVVVLVATVLALCKLGRNYAVL